MAGQVNLRWSVAGLDKTFCYETTGICKRFNREEEYSDDEDEVEPGGDADAAEEEEEYRADSEDEAEPEEVEMDDALDHDEL